jgi:hypothetical protein
MPVTQLSDGNPSGQTLGQATSDLVAFYGTTPVSQRASSDMATWATVASSASFASGQAAALNGVVLAVNEIRATLVALGLHKGAA